MNSVFLGRARTHVVPQPRAPYSPHGLTARIHRAPHRTDARKRKRVVVAFENPNQEKSPGQTGASFFVFRRYFLLPFLLPFLPESRTADVSFGTSRWTPLGTFIRKRVFPAEADFRKPRGARPVLRRAYGGASEVGTAPTISGASSRKPAPKNGVGKQEQRAKTSIFRITGFSFLIV